MKLGILTILVCTVAACDRLDKAEQELSKPDGNILSAKTMKERLSVLKPGTPRLEVLRVAGLTEQDGSKRVSYYADTCGSIEEWVTSTGDKFYVQGHFFDQNGYRKEPYIIAVLRLRSKTEKGNDVIWSGVNLQTGIDIFSPAKTKGEQGAAGNPLPAE